MYRIVPCADLVRHVQPPLAVLAAFVLAFQPVVAYALPQGGVVAGGSASIASSGSQMTISQSTNRAIINWSSFDIASGEKVQINQPGATSIELERIGGNSASSILGSLSSNGQVWLINANGILFGNGSSINVAGLMATSSNISDQNFMAGNYTFDQPGNPDASITNWGHITISDNGLAALVGPHVTNNGLIEARLGKVQLASGDTFALDLYGDGLINLAVSPEVTSELVSNSGAIDAQGGNVLLTTAAAESVVNSLVNMDGIIDADAGATGNGGNVTIKSSGTTDFSGTITAKGGTDSGNGGNVETSGAILNASGSVNTTAAHGQTGNWLLDPTDITIETGGGSSLSGSTIDPSYIVSGLNGSNITLAASDSITVDNAINASGNASAGNLTLNATTDYLNAPITLKTGSILSGDATTVNVGASGFVQNGIDAAASAATVNLAAATYDLTSELVINKNLTLTGQSANTTILDGQNDTRVMEIDGTSGGITVNVNDVTMENGNGVDAAGVGAAGSGYNGAGGGLLVYAESGNKANVTINNSTLSGNTAENYGGGIYNDGSSSGSATLTITNSSISGNLVYNDGGGGIYNEGGNAGNANLTINNSAISGNATAGPGGGIYNDEGSSGVAIAAINNSTIANNFGFASGGIYNTGTTTIKNSTISGNTDLDSYATGAGILNDNSDGNATVTIGDTIIVGNTYYGSSTESDFYNFGGTLTDNGYNLFGQNGNAGGFTGNGTTDIELSGSISTVLNTTLANNGGPTETLALVSGSPAIGAGGTASAYEIDQRGYARNLSGNIDIGAYEYSSPGNPFDVTLTSDSSGTNIGELRTAINYSNNNPNFDPTITFDPTNFATQQTITLTQGELYIDSSLTLEGPTAGVILDANNATRVMQIDNYYGDNGFPNTTALTSLNAAGRPAV